jgi:hypothetical protein
MKKILLIIAVTSSLLLSSCTDEASARKALERSGYKSISVGGYGFFQGSHGDVYVTEFTATAPNGEVVTGVVTKGWFKGNTIRLND